MIELRNLTKFYPVANGLRYILRDVSLVIPSRINLGVLGPNGAGKSTFLRLIGGSEPANSGTIITDQEISWPIGLTTGFKRNFTGRQNVLFVCQINGLNSEESQNVIDQVKDFSELGEYFDMPIETYSSGMNGKLKFGLSMAFDFDVYLIDELTSAGDTIFHEKAKAAFEKIRKRASLIYVSHSLRALKESCQSALFLRDGQLDYYPNIDEGIEAYTAYIQDHRNHGNPKQGSKDAEAKKALRQAERVKNRASRKSEENSLAEDESAPLTARQIARKAARQKTILEKSGTEEPPESNQSLN
jgi:capsular polysaccharide transport system ATP-binding protein